MRTLCSISARRNRWASTTSIHLEIILRRKNCPAHSSVLEHNDAPADLLLTLFRKLLTMSY